VFTPTPRAELADFGFLHTLTTDTVGVPPAPRRRVRGVGTLASLAFVFLFFAFLVKLLLPLIDAARPGNRKLVEGQGQTESLQHIEQRQDVAPAGARRKHPRPVFQHDIAREATLDRRRPGHPDGFALTARPAGRREAAEAIARHDPRGVADTRASHHSSATNGVRARADDTVRAHERDGELQEVGERRVEKGVEQRMAIRTGELDAHPPA
jgi:hypothetical protein